MDVVRAAEVLGVDAGAREATLRSVYRRRLLRSHPDVSAEPSAHDRTAELTTAYRTLMGVLAQRAVTDATRHDASPTTGTTPHPDPSAEQRPAGSDAVRNDPVARSTDTAGSTPAQYRVAVTDSCTIAVDAAGDEVFMLLLDAAHELGEVAYLDPNAGLLEVIVEFIDAPTSSVVMTVQARGDGVDVFCSVEPLSGGIAPSPDAVTQLLFRTLCGAPRAVS